MVKDVLDAYIERDDEKALEVWRRDPEVDEYYNQLFRELLTYILEDPKLTGVCIDLMFVAKNLERIGDHATNIAEKIHYMVHGDQLHRAAERGAVKPLILVVEDEPPLQKLLAYNLEAAGFAVAQAFDGEEAHDPDRGAARPTCCCSTGCCRSSPGSSCAAACAAAPTRRICRSSC